MTDVRQFTAGQAAKITGVTLDNQREWRRRGHMPAGDGSWTRYTLPDLWRLRMMRALIDCGLPVSQAVEQLSQDFTDALASQVIAAGDPQYAPTFAVIARFQGVQNIDDRYYRDVLFKLEDIRYLQEGFPDGRSSIEFSSIIIIPLAVLAADMNEHLNQPDSDAKE